MSDGLVERVALQVARAVAHPWDNVPKKSLSYERKAARAILREVADAVEVEEQKGVKRFAGRSCANWIHEQAAEEGAENGD